MKLRLALLISCVVSSLALSAFSDGDDNGFYNPDEDREGAHFEIDDIGRLILGYRHDAYGDVSDYVFRRLSTYDLGIPLNEKSTVIGSVRRKVYDNRDGTYSVVDICGIKGVVSTGEVMEVAGVPIYTAIGAEHGYDFVNIRQYDNKLKIGYAPSLDLPQEHKTWIANLWEKTKERWFGLRYFYDVVQKSMNFFASYFRSPNDQFSPRYEDMLNVVQTPFRIPLDIDGFMAMEPGEIMSYTVLGGLFVTLGSGVQYVPWRASLNLNFFVRGAFRISVLKERNGEFAKIKVSRLRSHGHTLSGRVKGDWDIIEGLFFGSDLSVSIVPVRVATTEALTKVFDTLYRYDMTTVGGRRSYVAAVKGNFIVSEDFAFRTDDVEKIFDKETDGDVDQFRMNFNTLVWRTETSYQLDNALITVTDKDGINYVFRSASRNEIRRGNIFRKNHEKIQYFTEASVELEDPLNTTRGKNPVVLISLFISDRDTYGKEMKEYMQIIESILDDPQYFEEGRYKRDKNYGKMSAMMHFRLSSDALNRIMYAPEQDLWSILAKAFGVKESNWETVRARDRWVRWETYLLAFFRDKRALKRLQVYRDAKEIETHLREIRDEPDHQMRAQMIANYHRDSPFKWELLRVMLHLAGFDNIYGLLSVRGDRVDARDEQWGEEIDLERPNQHEREDREMNGRPIVERPNIAEVSLSYEEDADHFRMSFQTLTPIEEIEGFFFRISPIRAWWFRHNSRYQTPSDRDLHTVFEQGENGKISVILDKFIDDIPFIEHKRYEVSFAFRGQDGIWSIEPRFIFKYERVDSMYIQWIEPRPKE